MKDFLRLTFHPHYWFGVTVGWFIDWRFGNPAEGALVFFSFSMVIASLIINSILDKENHL